MTHSFWTNFILFLAGAVAAGIGLAGLIWPVAFHASSGIVLGDNPSLMSEVRAPAAALLVAGGFILASVRVARWRPAAIRVSAAVYLTYGLARVYSIAVDGAPDGMLLMAAAVELIIGGICGMMILRSRAAT
ncbi:DUF4345 domain-containing protein [Antarcticimicrobium luteum]|nr:DUF4345 domain-containing protein [Antarcticimicrobium luteum]